MSRLVDPTGAPVSTGPDNRTIARDLAAVAHQLQIMRDGLFHTNLLLEFAIDQINSKIRDTNGLSPIALEHFEAFAERRAKEVIELMREHQKAQAQKGKKVEIDE